MEEGSRVACPKEPVPIGHTGLGEMEGDLGILGSEGIQGAV